MTRGYAIPLALLSFVLVAGCQSGPTYEMGGEAEKKVQRALAEDVDGGAALSTGRMIYILPQGELVQERRKLIGTLRGGEVIPPYYAGNIDATSTSRAEARVMAIARPQVFEVGCSMGTLHVERVAQPGEPPTHYALSLIERRHVSTMWVKPSVRLEGAWRALFDAARRTAKSDPRLGGLAASSDRPLAAMRDIGVDLRGLEPE